MERGSAGTLQDTKNGKQDTTKWATAIITTLWHGFLQLWEARKDDQHGRDSAQKQEKERTLLLQRTRTLYDQLDQFDHEDQRFFMTPIAEWEQKPNKDIQDWLLIAEPLTEESKLRARECATRSKQPLLTSFYKSKTGRVTPPRYSPEAREASPKTSPQAEQENYFKIIPSCPQGQRLRVSRR